MRTTVEIPDALFRKAKALAALQGSSMKDLIVRAVERETEAITAAKPKRKSEPFKTSHLRLKSGGKLDLTGFDFDDLLG
ncbi:MAG TPA: hypothetical protein VEV85_09655 [Bryobacteraceae bacterium]|jgi:hypothetical protein|nr:hypothetical protein [Bryobacteraceae bacterium]